MDEDAAHLVATLALTPHPEGGFFRETFRSRDAVTTARGPRAASTAIYFLLPGGAFSALHRVSSDEVWHHYDGDPAELVTIDAEGRLAVTLLGRDLGRGHTPQHVVPAGVWQAARPLGSRFSLFGCTVAPGFDFADFEMPGRRELVARFPQHEAQIRALTRIDARID